MDKQATVSRQLRAYRLAREAEQVAIRLVRAMGYRAEPIRSEGGVWVRRADGRVARLEVRLSHYHRRQAGQSGRYQAAVRQQEQADVLLFIARNGRDWPFVIPMAAIEPRRNLAIWSIWPEEYQGQWAPYLNAWQYLHAAVAAAEPTEEQLPLFEAEGSEG